MAKHDNHTGRKLISNQNNQYTEIQHKLTSLNVSRRTVNRLFGKRALAKFYHNKTSSAIASITM